MNDDSEKIDTQKKKQKTTNNSLAAKTTNRDDDEKLDKWERYPFLIHNAHFLTISRSIEYWKQSAALE